ncbi:transposase [Mucilaginibacter psychrotolerans]|uniref:Transposase n=1 Tax=Mucilaginibacter psychrotolerans TaxID=1524096 RepID=A0A4Y8SF58_9SPHI|nr:transposase [Mucilaginibacter psychrotolerans]TFF37270.1 transposase [Mucilaginibacter psychrotolerans]
MSGKKTESPRRKYDEEFKRDVVKMLSSGRSVQDVSQSLGINSNMVHRWKAEQTGAGGTKKSLPDVAIGDVSGADYERVKARLREVEQERDILKKALGIFSRGI